MTKTRKKKKPTSKRILTATQRALIKALQRPYQGWETSTSVLRFD
jgi:hypothetical protein